MRPRERRPTGQTDTLRTRLEQIIDLNHPDTLIYRSKFGVFSDSIAERDDGGTRVGTARFFRSE